MSENHSNVRYYQFQEDDWEKIFHSFYDGIWIADGDGRTIFVNKAYEDLTGINREVVLGKLAKDLLEAGVLSQSAIPGVMKTLKPVTIINKMNDKRLLVTGVPVFNENNELHCIVCNVRDITVLTELQREIEKKNNLIQHYEMEIMHFRENSLGMEDGPVVKDQKMIELFQLSKHVASTQSTVLILGESGVGKEVLASWIHRMSLRNSQPFITVNCSAIPENLIESELFGYEQGAFTGAQKRKAGLFEMADNGTIFLDEIGELPLGMQVKLLRVLQEKQVQRIGGGKLIPVNVRVISATNRSLDKMIAEGTFREDLYYRLNVIPFTLPSLRDRKDDIPLLVTHFLRQFNKMYDRNVQISPVILDQMMKYHWPGNIRELKNIIERFVVIAQEDTPDMESLPKDLQVASEPSELEWTDTLSPLRVTMDSFEKSVIISTLKRATSIRQAAKSLEINHSTLVRKIQQYEIDYKRLVSNNNQ